MRLGRLVAAGLVAGAVAGFVGALLRPRPVHARPDIDRPATGVPGSLGSAGPARGSVLVPESRTVTTAPSQAYAVATSARDETPLQGPDHLGSATAAEGLAEPGGVPDPGHRNGTASGPATDLAAPLAPTDAASPAVEGEAAPSVADAAPATVTHQTTEQTTDHAVDGAADQGVDEAVDRAADRVTDGRADDAGAFVQERLDVDAVRPDAPRTPAVAAATRARGAEG